MYNIPQSRDRQAIAQEVARIHVPEFQPNADIEKSKYNDCSGDDNEKKMTELFSRLPKYNGVIDIKIQPHEFEKDDDSNFHIDYIAATANLRAKNYELQTTERSQIKRIAGNIIPAIATTTAMVTGLVCLEVYKFIQGHKNIESYRNAFVNMALPFFIFSEPMPPKKQKVNNRRK